MNISKDRTIFKVTDMISKPEIENNYLTLFNEEIILNEGTDLNISQTYASQKDIKLPIFQRDFPVNLFF